MTQDSALQSQDIVAGLGAAPRELLATCIALFEDSTLQRRLSERIEALKGKLIGSDAATPDVAATITSLQRRVSHWMDAPLPDTDLRLLLWIRLRDAFELPAQTFGSIRSARSAADDLVAAVLASMQPGTLERAKKRLGLGTKIAIPCTLDGLARQTLSELIASALDDDSESNGAARQALLKDMQRQVAELDPSTRQRLMSAVGASELNDEAIRRILLTGGGLAIFGSAVSLGGFSAYILAAQASAFIPFVSGPGLVSLVSVLSNPFTVVLATAGMVWWATSSANRAIQGAIAARVISLLALTGIAAGEEGLRRMVAAFARLPLKRNADTQEIGGLVRYEADWELVSRAHRAAQPLSPVVAAAMERTLPGINSPDRWDRLLRQDKAAMEDMAVLSTLTLGELIYNVHALNPLVLKAADFSRVEDLSDPVAFAAFAHTIEDLAATSHLGAISNLKGYVAEQFVASQLVQQGHVVEFPETSNQAGWDLSVDGVKFQVKNAADLDLLERHFNKGYDYPVLANSEVAQMLEDARAGGGVRPDWADNVHYVEGYSQASIQEMTDHSLNAGDGMVDSHVPTFAVLLNVFRQFRRYDQGETTGSQAIQEVLIGGTITAGLAVAGQFAGVTIGLLVFGPAGALVLGSALPILSRTQTSRARAGIAYVTQGESHRQWAAEAIERLERLIALLKLAIKEKALRLKSRTADTASSVLNDYLNWRVDNEVRFLREAWLRISALDPKSTHEIQEVGERLIVWLSTSTLHPAVYQKELSDWLEVLGRKPTIGENTREIAGKLGNAADSAYKKLKDVWKSASPDKKDS